MPKDGDSSRRNNKKKEPQPTKTELRIQRAQVDVGHAGLGFNHKHYVPIAKLKRGEIWALNYLQDNSKSMVTPVFEVTEPGKGKSLAQYAKSLFERVATEWTGLPFYLDTQWLGPKNAPPIPQNAKTVLSIAQSLGLNMVPVTSPFFPAEFQNVIRQIAAADGRGVMFRLSVNFFSDPPKLPGYLTGLMSALNVKMSEVDILIDLGYRPDLADVKVLGNHCLSALPAINGWRTVTLASGCFPDAITKQPHGKWIPFNRSDWIGWKDIASSRAAAGTRVPSFGDYGVRCGGRTEAVPNGPAPNVRYSAEEIIWLRRGPKEAYVMQKICAELVKKPFFSGAGFSEGDKQIALKATNPDKTNAGAEQWIQWCTNHHLELTAAQILSLPLP